MCSLREELPRDGCESVIARICKKNDRWSREFSWVRIASKPLTGAVVRQSSSTRERSMRKSQTGFRPSRGCVARTSCLRQICEHTHLFPKPTVSVFLDLKAALNSVARAILWRCMPVKYVPEKLFVLIQPLYANTRSNVHHGYSKAGPCFGRWTVGWGG